MKRGTPEHHKVDDLMARLRVSRCTAVGLLEMFWHLVAKQFPTGEITRLNPKVLATRLEFKKDPQKLISSLVAAGWVDELEDGRLIVHDWAEHADYSVQKLLKEKGLTFADGRAPSSRRKGGQVATESQPSIDRLRQSSNQVAPAFPEPEPKPKPIICPPAVAVEQEPLFDKTEVAKPASTKPKVDRKEVFRAKVLADAAPDVNSVRSAEDVLAIAAWYEAHNPEYYPKPQLPSWCADLESLCKRVNKIKGLDKSWGYITNQFLKYYRHEDCPFDETNGKRNIKSPSKLLGAFQYVEKWRIPGGANV